MTIRHNIPLRLKSLSVCDMTVQYRFGIKCVARFHPKDHRSLGLVFSTRAVDLQNDENLYLSLNLT